MVGGFDAWGSAWSDGRRRCGERNTAGRGRSRLSRIQPARTRFDDDGRRCRSTNFYGRRSKHSRRINRRRRCSRPTTRKLRVPGRCMPASITNVWLPFLSLAARHCSLDADAIVQQTSLPARWRTAFHRRVLNLWLTGKRTGKKINKSMCVSSAASWLSEGVNCVCVCVCSRAYARRR